MKFFYINLLFILPSLLFSQYGLYSNMSKHSIGINHLTKDSIFIKDVSFPYAMDDFKLDSTTNLLLLYFSESIQLSEDQSGMTINALFDYNKNELVWTNASKKGKNYFNFIDNKIFLNTKDGSGLWDIKTRQFAWKINSPLYINKELYARDIGIAPRLKENGNCFAGVNLLNGEVKWKFPDFKILGNVFHLPFIVDSTLFFVNEGLIAVNLNSGIVKSYNYIFNAVARDGNGSNTATLIGGLVGFIIYEIVDNAAARGGVKTPDHFVSHHSNFLIDSFVYIGSGSQLHKFTRNGLEVANAVHYKDKTAGISELFYLGSKKCFLNFGYSIEKGARTNTGCSYVFIERFDDSLNLLQTMNYKDLKNKYYDGVKGEVIDYRIFNDSLHLLFENALLVLDTSLNITSSKIIYYEDKWTNRLDRNFCYRHDSSFDCIDVRKTSDYFIQNKNGSICWYNLRGDKVKTIPKNNIFYETYTDDKIKVVGYQSDDYILDRNNKLIIDVPGIDKVLKNGKEYIFGFQSGFMIIDENQLVK
jgi:hypothetical protein